MKGKGVILGLKCNTLEKHAKKTKVILGHVTVGQEGKGILFEQEM